VPQGGLLCCLRGRPCGCCLDGMVGGAGGGMSSCLRLHFHHSDFWTLVKVFLVPNTTWITFNCRQIGGSW